ncbi:hypothetical protein DPEC_G00046950 [Dallia pectoralis]|uniref:Uncharacterized protein n=1 Tax=Dallia pectoralis TaxID=75939 RepID=A0ACC2HB20_DALPE|nr:hypothetical protein DPEC_G00046950 [Dallia pectoralis]
MGADSQSSAINLEGSYPGHPACLRIVYGFWGQNRGLPDRRRIQQVLARLLEETILAEKSLRQQTSLCKRLRSFFIRDTRVDPPPAAENPLASVRTGSRLIFVSPCAGTFQNTGDRRVRDERFVISNSWAKSRASRASEKRLPSIPEETLEEMNEELSRDEEDQPPTSLWKRLQRFCKRKRSPAVVGLHQNDDVPTTFCFPYFHCRR